MELKPILVFENDKPNFKVGDKVIFALITNCVEIGYVTYSSDRQVNIVGLSAIINKSYQNYCYENHTSLGAFKWNCIISSKSFNRTLVRLEDDEYSHELRKYVKSKQKEGS